LEEHPDLKKKIVSKSKGFIEFNSDKYKDGFLYKSWNIAFLETENVTPSLDELQNFQAEKDTSNLNKMLVELNDNSQVATASAFKKGEDVEVIVGESTGLIGVVQNVEVVENVITVVAKNDAAAKGINFKFAPHELRKYFAVGDSVRVKNGRYEGTSAMVAKIDGNIATLISDIGKEEIQVFVKDIEKSIDTSTSYQQVGGYNMYDLVSLDANNLAVIIGLEREALKVIDQNSVVKTVKLQEVLQKKIFKNSVASDRYRNHIKVDDMVTVLEGPHQNKKAKILHLVRATAFLHINEVITNGGVFVSLTKNLALSGGNQTQRSGNQFSEPAPRQAMKRKDPLLNMTVTITRGHFKGHIGRVADVNNDNVHILLHSRPKPISISKNDIMQMDSKPAPSFNTSSNNMYEGNRTPGSIGSQTPAYHAGGRTPAYGSQTPGSRTPGYEGGATPGWDGGRTPVWDAGARTPSQHHTPSWQDSHTPSNYTPGNPATPQGETPSETPRTPRGEYLHSSANTPSSSASTPSSSHSTPFSMFGSHSGHHSHVPGTPGNNPQTPNYTPGRTPATPSTPGNVPQTPYSGGYDESIWISAGLEVYDDNRRKGVIREVNGETCIVLIEGRDGSSTYHYSSLEPVRPSMGDRLRVIEGDHKGEIGSLISTSGADAIVRTENGEVAVLVMDSLCKYQS